jgi:hypothetical protein
VLGGLAISTKKIWPRRKEVEERKEGDYTISEVICGLQWSKAWISEVIHGLQWSKAWMYVGHSEAKHGCCGLTVDESWICVLMKLKKVNEDVILLMSEVEEGLLVCDLMHQVVYMIKGMVFYMS